MKCAGFVVNTSVSSAYWSVLVKYCLRGKNDKGATVSGMGPIVTSGKCPGGFDEQSHSPVSKSGAICPNSRNCKCRIPAANQDDQDDHVKQQGSLLVWQKGLQSVGTLSI